MENDALNWEEKAYRGFACPHEGLNEELMNFIVVEHSRAVCQAFLEKSVTKVRDKSDGLAQFITSWLGRDATFDEVWTLGLARLRAALRPGHDGESVQAAAQFALDLHTRGLSGGWTAHLAPGTRLRWDGWLLPAADEFTVTSDGTSAVVTAQQDGIATRTSIGRRDGQWYAENADPLPQARLKERPIFVLMPEALACRTNDDIRPRLVREVAAHEIVSALQGAVDLLVRYAPKYLTWVSRVLRGIIPLATAGDMYFSGSYPERPGVVTCSFPVTPEIIAELLVHEATHQYFHILAKLGPVDDGSDTALYYSPLRQQGRPLTYILLGYHATANMLLFHRDCLNGGTPHALYSRAREIELSEYVRQLEPPLRTSAALTALGSSLTRPLAERL